MENKKVEMSIDVHLKDLNEIDFLINEVKLFLNDERIAVDVRNEYGRKLKEFYVDGTTHNADEVEYFCKDDVIILSSTKALSEALEEREGVTSIHVELYEKIEVGGIVVDGPAIILINKD